MTIGVKLKPQQEIIISALMGIGALLVWYFVLYQPLSARTSELEKLVHNQADSLKALERYRSEISRMRSQIDAIRVEEVAWENRFPPRRELVSLARRLIDLGKEKGLTLLNIRPSLQELYALERSGVPVSSQNLMKLPIRIRFQGRFHNIGKFLEELSLLPFQTTVADFAIVQQNEIYPDVEVVFFMFLYVRW